MSKNRLKVYGWTGVRFTRVGWVLKGITTREVVAAHTVRDAQVIADLTRREWREQDGGLTRDKEEVAVALERPGTIFWTPLYALITGDAVWEPVDARRHADI
jgi:hypothetical protein